METDNLAPYNPGKATNQVKGFIKGLPCMYGKIVCRMVGVHPQMGKYETVNGLLTHSYPIIMTPHGTAMNPGVEYVSEITQDGMDMLLELETEMREEGEKLYDGYLKEDSLFTITF